MALPLASRFSVLSIEDDDDVKKGPKQKKKTDSSKTSNTSGQKNDPKKGKKPASTKNQPAVTIQATNKTKPNKSSRKKANVDDKQWELWKQKDEEDHGFVTFTYHIICCTADVEMMSTADDVIGSGTLIKHETSQLSSTLLFAILIGILLLIFIIVDVSCYFVHHAGVLYLLCGKSSRKQPREDDTKLASLYSWRFPLPYCSNKETSPSDSNSNGNNSVSELELKRPLPDDMNFVFEGKELLNSGHRDAKIHIESTTPMIDNNLKKDTAVQYDIKKAVSKTGFVSKDSAV